MKKQWQLKRHLQDTSFNLDSVIGHRSSLCSWCVVFRSTCLHSCRNKSHASITSSQYGNQRRLPPETWSLIPSQNMAWGGKAYHTLVLHWKLYHRVDKDGWWSEYKGFHSHSSTTAITRILSLEYYTETLDWDAQCSSVLCMPFNPLHS
jgi:hypothetical protein